VTFVEVDEESVESRFEAFEDCCWTCEVDGIRDEGGGVEEDDPK
jgi:hypothetical protein